MHLKCKTVNENWKRKLAEQREANNNAAWSMSEYINETPCAITEGLMKEADPEGELPEELLYAAFMAGFCGIHEDDTTINGYFQEAVHLLETTKYIDNPYLKNIKFPDTATRHWKFTHYSYRPYEAFICNDIDIDIDKNEKEKDISGSGGSCWRFCDGGVAVRFCSRPDDESQGTRD